jgi:hypothetical protein
MNQQEYDELDAIVVHLLVEGIKPPTALCSGEEIDPNRWQESRKPRKLCQACLRAVHERITP